MTSFAVLYIIFVISVGFKGARKGALRLPGGLPIELRVAGYALEARQIKGWLGCMPIPKSTTSWG